MMKKIILICALFFSLSAIGQSYTYIAQRYEWLAGLFKALGLPSGDSAQFQIGQRIKAGAIYYDSTGVDSGLYVWTGSIWRKQGVGSVTNFSIVTANGFSGSVSNPTTTPALTLSTNQTGLLYGNGASMTGTALGAEFERINDSLKSTMFANVENFGAIGDGATLNDAAFLAAKNTERPIYVPAGNFKLSTLLTLNKFQVLFGDDWNSIISITANTAAIRVDTGSRVTGIKFIGNGKAGSGTFNTGVYANDAVGWSIDNCMFENFSGDPVLNGGGGIFASGIAPNNSDGGRITNNYFFSNDCGLNLATRGEYVTTTANAFGANTVAILAAGGNQTINSNIIQNNTTGIKSILATNGAHSTFNGNELNHNTYPLWLEDAPFQTSFNINGGWIVGGAIKFIRANNVHFSNVDVNALDSVHLDSSKNLTRIGGWWGLNSSANPIAINRYNGAEEFNDIGVSREAPDSLGNFLNQYLKSTVALSDSAQIAGRLILKGNRPASASGADSVLVWNTTTKEVLVRAQNDIGGGATAINDIADATAAGLVTVGNNSQQWDFTGLTGSGLLIQSNTTAAINNTHKVLRALTTGANASASIRSFAFEATNTHTGIGSTNVGANFSASGGDANHAIIVGPTNGNIGFGTNDPDVSAMLDVASTTKGAVFPRMTGAQQNAIPSPITGLMIYNTDSSSYCFYNGTAWLKFNTGAGGGGSGDVVGPASATDGVPALFNGTTGKLIKNSTPTGTGNPVMQTSPTVNTKLTLTGATETISNPVLDATQTWNAAGTTFTAHKLDVTNTASAAGSLLTDFQIGGVSQGSLRKDGSNLALLGHYVGSTHGTAGTGMELGTGTRLFFRRTGTVVFQHDGTDFQVGTASGIGWGALAAASPDTKLNRDGTAGIMAQKNGATAQEFRIYNTDVAADDEFASIGFKNTTNVLTIETEALAAGVVRNIAVMGGNVSINSSSTFTDRFNVNGNINLLTAGNKLKIATGANASIGTATLAAGTVTVSTTAVVTGSKIFVTVNTPGGTQGFLSVPDASIITGTSFVINSTSGTETSTVNWWIIN